MAIVMERELAAVAFAEPDDDFAFRASGASGLGEYVSESQWRAKSRTLTETAWIRRYISQLNEMTARLNHEVREVVRELPRIQAFRHELRQFLRTSVKQQAEQRSSIVASIRSSSVRAIYLDEVLRQCSASAGPNSFDLAIDFLSEFDADLLEVFHGFLNKDRARWLQATAANHANDDICYVLLRALARSNVASQTKLDSISECLTRGTSSIREAATHALGDLEDDAATCLLKQAADQEADPLVRESAQETLDDLDT